MTRRNHPLSLFTVACAIALLAACAKPAEDTDSPVVAPVAPTTATAEPSPPEPAAKLPGDAPATRWIAHGNEPFWSVAVDGTTLTWKTPDMPAGKTLTAERLAYAKGVNFSGNDAGKAFTLDIKTRPCSDDMSDQTFEFTALWEYGGETMTGCASASLQSP